MLAIAWVQDAQHIPFHASIVVSDGNWTQNLSSKCEEWSCRTDEGQGEPPRDSVPRPSEPGQDNVTEEPWAKFCKDVAAFQVLFREPSLIIAVSQTDGDWFFCAILLR
jgi:hypothetical protein